MDLYTLKESQTIELKEASDRLPSNLFETYSSFANTCGGVIYLGVREKAPRNIIVGVKNLPMLKKAFFDTIHNKSKVSVAMGGDEMWREIEIDGKTVVEIQINEAPISLKPVYLNGNPAFAYLRSADGDYLASTFERRAMELDAVPQKFDMRPNSGGYGLKDLNVETLNAYRAIFNARNPDNLLISDTDEEFFARIGALRKNENGNLVATNAAVLLFGNYLIIKESFPEYNLDYREQVSGSSRWDYRLDASSLTWSGNAFDFYRNLISHLQPKLPNRFHLSGVYEDGGEGIMECVREGLTNAIANCDYLLPGGVRVIYDGYSVFFQNAGKLRLPLSQVLIGGDSDPRNEGVMNLLHLAKIGDKAGEGIPNVFRRMRSLGLPDPILKQTSAPFKTSLTLFVSSSLRSDDSTLDSKVLHYLTENGPSSVSEIAKGLSVNNAMISISLKGLVNSGIVANNGKKTRGKKFWINGGESKIG